ncbi:VanW family protein [Calidithermus timidus]|jgi:vancomycin resistance protein YoaR|uniref:VanW family protein n=1 Tax=Calidithermus timidus TaxID=307124 RepID=UPI0006972A96|nr:VanW family protein [Calidithermus timidus]
MRWTLLSALFSLSPVALAGPDALLVTQEWTIEQGQLKTYTGVQRYKVGGVGEIETLIRKLGRPPTPAKWVFTKDRGWVAIERPGYAFGPQNAKNAYLRALKEGKKEFRLPVAYQRSSRSVDYWYALGVRELISEATTTFYGSIPARIYNIAHASAKLDGVLIPPNTTFSFLQTIGEISVRTGFREAYVIVGDKTEIGVGGGVCQTSTTLFRAAYFAGLPILERRPHSYQVGYYSPTGLDAAVYSPTQDLKFKNDTPGHILIQTQVRGYRVTYRFFGTKDRSTTWSAPVVRDVIPAPPTRFIVDPSLRYGQRKQIDFAAPGAQVTVYRTIQFDDGRVVRDSLFSKYRPWAAVYLVGPTEPAPPAPDPTPPLTPEPLPQESLGSQEPVGNP